MQPDADIVELRDAETLKELELLAPDLRNSECAMEKETSMEGDTDGQYFSPNVEIIADNVEVPEPILPKRPTRRAFVTLSILILINLLNYMDRYTLASVLEDVKLFYELNDSKAGLLQTAFIVSYSVLAPLFGFLGDRFSRKILMAVGIAIWSATTLACSFIPKEHFAAFFVMRGLVGVGEASYATLSTTVIADLFVGDWRTRALSAFYFAVPLGSGLGYIVGSLVAKALGGWQWAFRVTPGLAVLCCVLLLVVAEEPPRGAAEGMAQLKSSTPIKRFSILQDCWYIITRKSYTFSSLGFAGVSFVIGGLSFWAPQYLYYSAQVYKSTSSSNFTGSSDMAGVSYQFGIVTTVAGLTGVISGGEAAARWRHRKSTADVLVCAFSIIASVPFAFLALILAKTQYTTSWVLIAIAEYLLCWQWTPNSDILLAVIHPSYRGLASALQILTLHALGDAISPPLIGLISDLLRKKSVAIQDKQSSLEYALLVSPFILVLAAVFYFIAAYYYVHDTEIVRNTPSDGRVSNQVHNDLVDHPYASPEDVTNVHVV